MYHFKQTLSTLNVKSNPMGRSWEFYVDYALQHRSLKVVFSLLSIALCMYRLIQACTTIDFEKTKINGDEVEDLVNALKLITVGEVLFSSVWNGFILFDVDSYHDQSRKLQHRWHWNAISSRFVKAEYRKTTDVFFILVICICLTQHRRSPRSISRRTVFKMQEQNT
jgi:hypothetical protein